MPLLVLLLHIDQPVRKQMDWFNPPTLGVGASLSASPRLGRLVTSNPMLPLLPEHAMTIHVVSYRSGLLSVGSANWKVLVLPATFLSVISFSAKAACF